MGWGRAFGREVGDAVEVVHRALPNAHRHGAELVAVKIIEHAEALDPAPFLVSGTQAP